MIVLVLIYNRYIKSNKVMVYYNKSLVILSLLLPMHILLELIINLLILSSADLSEYRFVSVSQNITAWAWNVIVKYTKRMRL